MRVELLDAARTATRPDWGRYGYAVAYGSHACGTAGPGSDLDLLVVTPRPLAGARLLALADRVRQLHADHELVLDEEVTYELKVHAAWSDVATATALLPFRAASALSVLPVGDDPVYLNSTAFKQRLVLNALTSPHAFLGGDEVSYECHRAAAVAAVTLLGRVLADAASPSTAHDPDSVVEALLRSPCGHDGKDFLGYRDRDELAPRVRAGLAFLDALEEWRPRAAVRRPRDRP